MNRINDSNSSFVYTGMNSVILAGLGLLSDDCHACGTSTPVPGEKKIKFRINNSTNLTVHYLGCSDRNTSINVLIDSTTYNFSSRTGNGANTVESYAINGLTTGYHDVTMSVMGSNGDFLFDGISLNDGGLISAPNTAPTISGSNSSLGNKLSSFDITYTINDTDLSDTLTIVETVDSTTINTINNAIRNQNYTLSLSSVFNGLSLGAHTITITASDNNGSNTVRTYTFTKVDDRLEFQLKNPLITTAKPNRIVFSGIFTIPSQSTIQILACNNGLDVEPTWEDITNSYINNQSHTFTNNTKVNANWAINIKVKIIRTSITTQLSCDAFGFSFD